MQLLAIDLFVPINNKLIQSKVWDESIFLILVKHILQNRIF